jgi:hypothetical protein
MADPVPQLISVYFEISAFGVTMLCKPGIQNAQKTSAENLYTSVSFELSESVGRPAL